MQNHVVPFLHRRTRGIFAAAVLLLTATGLAHAQRYQSLAVSPLAVRSVFAQVKKWRLDYTTVIQAELTAPDGSAVSVSRTAQGTAVLEKDRSNPLAWEGTATSTGEVHDSQLWTYPNGFMRMTADGSGPAQDEDTLPEALVINAQKGTFTFRCFQPFIPVHTMLDTSEGLAWERDDEVRVVWTTPGGATPPEMPLPNPKKITGLAFHGTVPVYVGVQFDGLAAQAQLDWTLTPVDDPPVLVLLPTSKKWMPKPDGKVSVSVVPEKKGQPVPVRFTLYDITREPGTCLNSPDTDAAPDLQFDDTANAGKFEAPQDAGPNSFTIETLQPVTETSVGILAKDYGAWARIKADAFIDGAWKPVKVQGSTNPYTTLPLDTNENQIADTWEDLYRIRGKNLPPTWDGETRQGVSGDTPGDGLSLYEEYRGLIVRGAQKRLSPKEKELVVENLIGADAKKGLALFQTASKIRVVELQDPELPAGRQVNANTGGAGHAQDQYGLRLVAGDVADGVGEARPIEKTNKRPKDCEEVRIDLAELKSDPQEHPGGLSGQIAVTIAHELGHGIGARHHGDREVGIVDRHLTETMVPPRYTVYDSDGKLFNKRPLDITGAIGPLQSRSAGDVSCIMCYDSYYSWALHSKPAEGYIYYNVGLMKPGFRFCTSPKGTGINAASHKPAPYFGDAAAGSGDCLHQLDPKDH